MSWWLILLVFSPALLLWGALELFAVLRRRDPAPRRAGGARVPLRERAPHSRLSRWDLIALGCASRFDDATIERVKDRLK